ncbi:vacuolar ATPase assembly integral membrane protein VMA21 homolog [Drosophila innubila]|uniref:vacuolar ATPase assembly integral membrane protein VMA21 homolog n=1 Tax=Drosophila innubila TaxID=198719 RepID=UPI00148C759D|nr:vacuolar ATPase assembly integral membrane protein VMA21 homolog [Drosophila innubila]
MSNKTKKGNGNGGDGGQSKMAKQRSQDSHDYSSFKVVLFYCSLIVFLPVVTFFALKGFVLDQFFSMSDVKVNIASAVGAVAALHVALGLYIYRAYFGGSDKKAAQSKQD